LGRVEQSYLRHSLFGEVEHAVCSLCGRHLPIGLLVAAHAKPRSECSRHERLDARHVVFGVCLLGCDALYERGFVGVREKGGIVLTGAHSAPALKAALRILRGRHCQAWNLATAKYFEWHLSRRFQGA